MLLDWLIEFGVPAIFFAVLLEYACFPISSELLLPLSGMIAVQIGTPLWILIMLSIVAGLCGCSVCYWIGRFGESLLCKILRRFPKMANQLEKTCNWQKKYGAMSVMIGRVIPIFRTYISFVAGLTKQRFIRYIGFSAIGVTAWNSLLLSAGYFLGAGANGIVPLLQRLLLFLGAIICILGIVRMLLKRRKKRRVPLKTSSPK